MKFKIEMTLDNDAFADAPALETRRILQSIVNRLTIEQDLASLDGFKIRGINGNVVGVVLLTDD